MRTKQTILAPEETAAEGTSCAPGPVRRGRVSGTAGKSIHGKRTVVKKKTSNGNGHGEVQSLVPLGIQSEFAAGRDEASSGSAENPSPAGPHALPEITDQLFLNTVRDQVYRKLIDGEIKLDVGDGFKAIEIKHKISEESQNEKLLLEILNEIRAEELNKSK